MEKRTHWRPLELELEPQINPPAEVFFLRKNNQTNPPSLADAQVILDPCCLRTDCPFALSTISSTRSHPSRSGMHNQASNQSINQPTNQSIGSLAMRVRRLLKRSATVDISFCARAGLRYCRLLDHTFQTAGNLCFGGDKCTTSAAAF